MTMSFPQVGPEALSDAFYALLCAWVRLHELVFELAEFLFTVVVGDRAAAS